MILCGNTPMFTHDLLDNLGRGVEVDESLVDPHLVSVPGLRTLTTWAIKCISAVQAYCGQLSSRLSGGVLEDFGWEPDGAFDSEVSVLGSVDEVGADWNLSVKVLHPRSPCSHFSRGLTFREVRVILILWILAAPAPDLSRSSL